MSARDRFKRYKTKMIERIYEGTDYLYFKSLLYERLINKVVEICPRRTRLHISLEDE